MCVLFAKRCVRLPEALVRVSVPLPLEIVVTDISQGGNEGPRGSGGGSGWGIKNASGKK